MKIEDDCINLIEDWCNIDGDVVIFMEGRSKSPQSDDVTAYILGFY
jgi:hypothetical protein